MSQRSGNSRNYIDLAELIKRERTSDKKALVEEVLNQELSVTDKIEKIQEIDARTIIPDNELFSISRSVDTEAFAREHRKVTSLKAEKNRKKIKLKMEESGFFTFLFFELSKIIRFINKKGRKYDLMRYTIIPPRVRMNRRIQEIIENNFQKHAIELISPVDAVLKYGWRYLTMFQYNQVVLFKEFLSELLNLDFRRFNLDESHIIDKIEYFEELFYSLISIPQGDDTISSSIELVLKNLPKWQSRSSKFEPSIHKLLDPLANRPSLESIMISLNMVKYKKFLKLSDFCNMSGVNIIATFSYDTSKSIQDDIDSFIDERRKYLLSLVDEQRKVMRVSRYISLSGSGEYDDDIFQKYYHHYTKVDINPQLARQYPAKFLLTVLNMFSAGFEELLSGTVAISSSGRVRIFTPEVFQYDIAMLNMEKEKLKKYGYLFDQFTMDRFSLLRSSPHSSSQSEKELLRIIDESLLQMKKISDKLITIEIQHSSQTVPESSPMDMKPLEFSPQGARGAVLPHFDKGIISKSYLSGLSVYESIYDLISILLQLFLYFSFGQLREMLMEQEHLEGEIETTIETLRRISTVVQLNEIRKELPLVFKQYEEKNQE